MPQIIVKKFGGSSVASLQKIKAIAKRLHKDLQKGEKFLVVISAMAGHTDRLIKTAEKIDPSCQGEAYDMLLSSGEQVSLSLLSLALNKKGVKNMPLLAHQAGIQTDSLFSRANIQSIKTDKIKEVLKEDAIPLVAGFQGFTKENQITTLGRGGSDLTALALTFALKQKMCEIYTDVPGVFTADPRIVPSARKLPSLGFSEMMEMSSLGSKVLQYRCVELAAKHKIKIHVRHAFKEEEGTWIINKENVMEGSVVSSVAHDLNTLLIKVKNIPKGVNFISNLFLKLGEKSVFVDVISQNEISEEPTLVFSISKSDLKTCLKIVKDMVDERNISVIDQIAKISVIGVGMAHHSGVAGRFFSVFQKLNVHLYLVTTSEVKISAIIDRVNLKTTAQALHKEFGLSS